MPGLLPYGFAGARRVGVLAARQRDEQGYDDWQGGDGHQERAGED
ncbi:hypothetical protein [Arthrobacter sp. ISL-28]|nr:hypothetical protein [Arthrobacter sp. ISL-28]